jgi:hypothetical protein
MVLFGFLAILQIAALPGSLILKAVNFHGSFLQRVIYSFALSLIATYCLIFTLSVVHLYNPAIILLILCGEIFVLIWLYRKDLQTPFFENLQQYYDNFKNKLTSFVFPGREAKPFKSISANLLNILITIGLCVFAISGIVWTLRVFIGNLGSVFEEWDAVVSWNRWALDWAVGRIPLDSGLYPQLIPANWSLTYVLVGNTIIQTLAKGIMPLFAMFILLALFDLGWQSRRIGFFIGGILAQLMIKKFLGAEITNGYVDVAVALFGLLAIHALIAAGNTNNSPSYSDQCLLLGAVFAAGAAITKQPGLYIFALYPVLAYINVIRHTDPKLKNNLKKYLSAFLLVSLIPLSWYVFKEIHFILNTEVYDIQTYFDITAQAYGQAPLHIQIASAFSRFEIYLVLFILVIASLPLLNPFYRALTLLIVLPYPLIWARMAGYDTRNLAIFLPVFAVVSGIALQKSYEFIVNRLEGTVVFQIKTYTVIALFLGTLSIALLLFPSGRLIEQQTELQKQILSPSLNEKIYAIVEQDGLDTKILTNYPLRFLPGLENNQVSYGFKNLDSFLMMVENPEIQYILYSNKASDEIKQYINDKVNNGDYELVFNDKEWIPYKMIHIIHRQ